MIFLAYLRKKLYLCTQNCVRGADKRKKMKITQEQIDNIHKISDWCTKGILLVGFIIMFLNPGNWFWWVSGISLLVAIIVNSISAHWATDKEKEEFKRAVKEAVQEAQKEKKSRIKTAYNEKSPLIDLEPKQIAVVHQILCNIPEENGHIRTSELVQVLRALAGRGDLDDGNKGALIAWVENLTGKAVDARNFKYDYDNKYSEKGVSKQAKKIVTEFDKLR